MEYQLSQASKNRFSSHTADQQNVEKMFEVRKAIRELALKLEMIVPESRDRSTAFTHLQAVMMFSNAAICENLPINENEK